ncbi:MAG: hypothetical protein KDB03_19275 [Planctomycetales bacterium]|nr:hypothetical protein [Planctomycetales bacterium]
MLPLGIFVLLRLPAMVHLPGGQDEQFFSVPGYTVWQCGIPRIPYLPTKNRSTFFENADRCLMTLPPGLFYAQAPFFAIFPAGYPTSRIPLFLGALAVVVLTFAFGIRLGCRPETVWAACIILALSRPLLFTALTARPDLLCVLCGLMSIALLVTGKEFSTKRVALIGVCCGFSGLFHPFALVFCIQIGCFLLVSPGTLKDRAVRILAVSGATLAVLALWLPLILMFPYEFQSQFFSNVLDRAGPGLPARLLWPLDSIRHHAVLLWEFAGPWQLALLAVGLGVATVAFAMDRDVDSNEVTKYRRTMYRRILWLAWTSVYLTATVAGLHPTKGYWLYSTILILLCTARSANRLAIPSRADLANVSKSWPACGLLAMCVLVTLPGAGLKSSWIYLRYWNDPQYHGARFISSVLEDLPRDGLFLADLSYVFDVYLSGRETLLCQEKDQYWGPEPIEYNRLLLAWEGEDAQWAKQYDASLEKRYGSREIIQACFVDCFVPKDSIGP